MTTVRFLAPRLWDVGAPLGWHGVLRNECLQMDHRLHSSRLLFPGRALFHLPCAFYRDLIVLVSWRGRGNSFTKKHHLLNYARALRHWRNFVNGAAIYKDRGEFGCSLLNEHRTIIYIDCVCLVLLLNLPVKISRLKMCLNRVRYNK